LAEGDDADEQRQYVAKALGGRKAHGERFAIYIPNKGRSPIEGNPQVEIPDWESWVRRAVDVLGDINGGATAYSPSIGYYADDERGGERVWERTVFVYSFVDRDVFRARISEIRSFAHEFGRETRQGSVFFEFDGYAYSVSPPYDS